MGGNREIIAQPPVPRFGDVEDPFGGSAASPPSSRKHRSQIWIAIERALTMTSFGVIRAKVEASSAVEHSVTMNSDGRYIDPGEAMRSPAVEARAR